MNARGIREHFLARCDWVEEAGTVDRVIAGDPGREAKSAVVTWIASFDACRQAARKKADLLVTHEPTFWKHANEMEQVERDAFAREKLRFIEEAGLTILRIHDSWDRFPDIGIPFAWAEFLGLQGPPARVGPSRYQHRYDIEPVKAGEFARRVAERTAGIGEPMVQFIGDAGKIVSRIGIGTGCCCSPLVYEEMGCDLYVVCDDGSSYWRYIQRSVDAGAPVVRVHHGTSEEPGMVTLARYLSGQFPGVRFEHLPHRPCYVAVGKDA